MKKLFFFISIATLVFNSCQKDALDATINNESMDELKSEVKVVNGVLTFKNGNDFSEITEVLSNMSETELFEWENSIGFKSYKRAFVEFNDQLDRSKTEEEFNRILDENKSLYKMNGDMIESLIPIEFYATLVNVERTYTINTTKYTVDDQNIIIEDNDRKVKEIIKYNLNDKNQKAPVNAEVIKDCDKRRVIGNTSLYLVIWVGSDPLNGQTTQLQRIKYEIKSRGYKKYFGNWHLYKTDHNFMNIQILNIKVPIEKYPVGPVYHTHHSYEWGYVNYEKYAQTNQQNLQTATIDLNIGSIVYVGNSTLYDPHTSPSTTYNFSLLNHYYLPYLSRNIAWFKTTGTASCDWAKIEYYYPY